MSEPGPSNTSVERAGALLRAVALGEAADVDPASVEAARDVVEQFRRRFLRPHLELREELVRLAAAELPLGASVTARWKRYDRIVDKLVRLPRHRLPQMQDVGGCRVVARSPQLSLNSMADAIAEHWDVVADDDYVAHPRETGYRARHVVVRYSEMPIEIQLRNVLQDQWAELYETVHRNSDVATRDPSVQAGVAAFFVALSAFFARRETGTIEGEPAFQELVDLLGRYAPLLNSLTWNPPDRLA